MKRLILLAAFVFGSLHISAQRKWNYPPAPKIPVYDTLWGTVIQDDYHWVENVKAPEVESWLKEQADFTNRQLAGIPGQEKLINELIDQDVRVGGRVDPCGNIGDKYFYMRRDPGSQVNRLYVKKGESGEEILLFDPQQYIEGKSMNYTVSLNQDGSMVLLNLSEAGKEIGDIRILDVATRKLLPEIIPYSFGKFLMGSRNEIIYNQAKGDDVFNDPRVPVYFPAKFAAAMQAKNASDHPVFLMVDFDSGHSGGSTINERFRQAAREYAFLLWQTGHPDFQPE